MAKKEKSIAEQIGFTGESKEKARKKLRETKKKKKKKKKSIIDKISKKLGF